MNGWSSLPADVQALAGVVLTVKQRDIWKLELGGMSPRQIADALGVSRSNVREHLDAAHRKLAASGVRYEQGEWLLVEAA